MRTLFTCTLNWKLTREHDVHVTPSKAYTALVPSQYSLYPSGRLTLEFYMYGAYGVSVAVGWSARLTNVGIVALDEVLSLAKPNYSPREFGV